MSSNALESQGTVLKISDETSSPWTYAAIAEVREFTGPGGSAAVIDVSDLDSTFREKRMGLPDEGQLSFVINYIPSDTEHALLRTQRAARALTYFQIDFTDSPTTTWTFSGYVLEFSVSGSVDETVLANVTIEITGAITES